MKEMFLHVADVIKTKVPEIRSFDFDLGQFEVQEPPVSWPAVLFDYNDATYEDLSQGIQQVEQSFTLRIGFRLFERTGSTNNDTDRAKALEHLDIVKKIADSINGSSSANTTGYKRVGLSREKRADYRIYAMTFEAIGTEVPEEMPYNTPPVGFEADFCLTEGGIKIEPITGPI